MSNPLRIFRKYQAALLVAFGVVLMFAFVIGPVLSDYLQSRASRGKGANPAVVAWQGGELREADIAHLRSVQLLATRFLRQLVSRVRVVEEDVRVQRKGKTVRLIPGRTYPLLSRNSGENGISYQIVVEGEAVTVPRQKEGASSPQVEPIRPRQGVQMITQSTGEEDLVRRVLLAEEARERGVVVSEGAVIDYLDSLGDVTPDARPDYRRLLKSSTNGRLNWSQFLEHMSLELAAQRMLIMSHSGLLATSPDLLYQCYNKLNRRITAELLAVNVRDFLGQVGEPTEQEVKALYEEGKDRFPNPDSPKPGFKQRKKIKFQYVVGTFNEFLEREMERIKPTITDEEIEQYYNENKENYKITELPKKSPAAGKKTPAGKTPGKVTPKGKKAEGGAEEKVEEQPREKAAKDAAKKEAPASDEAEGSQPAPSTKSDGTEGSQKESPADDDDDSSAKKDARDDAATNKQAKQTKPSSEPETKSEGPKNETDGSGEKGPEGSANDGGGEQKTKQAADGAKTESENGSSNGSGSTESPSNNNGGSDDQAAVSDEVTTWVSYRQPVAAEGTPRPSVEKKAASAEKEGSSAQEKPAIERARKTESNSSAKKEAQPPVDQTKAAGDAKDEAAKAKPKAGAKKTTESPEPVAGDDSATEPKSAGQTKKEAAKKPVRYKPLNDELRAEIREQMAREQARRPAQDKLENAVDQVRSKLEKFARDLTLSEALEEREAPEPLDLQNVAEENNLEFRETPRWDRLDVSLIQESEPQEDDPPAYELARATETMWSRTGQRQRSLLDVGFTGEVEKYMPREFVDGVVMPSGYPMPPQKLFLYWRVAEDPERVPPLKEVRGRVVHQWKMQQALPLVQVEAAKMAEKASEAGQPLKAVFPDGAETVIETTQFNWMTRGSMPGRTGGMPMLSQITGMANNQPVNVSGVDNDFMRSVFALDVGQVGTAINAPETFVYVVRVKNEDRSDKQRREAFYESGPTQDINRLVQQQQSEIALEWLEDLEEKHGLQWKREPETDWNTRARG